MEILEGLLRELRNKSRAGENFCLMRGPGCPFALGFRPLLRPAILRASKFLWVSTGRACFNLPCSTGPSLKSIEGLPSTSSASNRLKQNRWDFGVLGLGKAVPADSLPFDPFRGILCVLSTSSVRLAQPSGSRSLVPEGPSFPKQARVIHCLLVGIQPRYQKLELEAHSSPWQNGGET